MKTGTALLILLSFSLTCGTAQARRVACVGDSITYGSGIADRARDSYPAQLERMLQLYDPTWEVDNFGVSGATLLRRGDRPYIQESAYSQARASNADIVIIKLGTNDSKPQNWQYKEEYVSDYANMIDVFRAMPSEPEVWICKPVPAFLENFSIRPDVIRDEILPLIDEIAAQKGVFVLDLYTVMLDTGPLFPDGIHPNAAGAGLMAEAIAPYVLGVRLVPDFNHDGTVNLRDFSALAQLWRQESTTLDAAPVPDGDGMVGYADLAALAKYWLTNPGITAHWRFDETEGDIAADWFGRFDGTVHGQAVWQPEAGRIRGALELDGLDDYVSTDDVVDPAAGAFTVLAWVKGGQPGQAIVSQSDSNGRGSVWLGTDPASGALLTDLTDGGRGTHTLVSDTVVTDGTWHKVCVLWDGSLRVLFVDGAEVAADAKKLSNLKSSRSDLLIGAGEAAEAGSLWSGLIDDVRIYNRALAP